MKLRNKNIVITGGSNGLGKAIALKLAGQGANIIITYHSDSPAALDVIDQVSLMGVRAKAIQVDLSDKVDCSRLVFEVCEFFGEVDALINNAGIVVRKSILDHTQSDIQKVFEVNVLSPFYLLQEFGFQMKRVQTNRVENGDEYKDYCIINITSISRNLPTGLSSYEVSKAALHQLTKSAAFELAQHKIRVNDIAPGLVPTNLNKQVWQHNQSLWNQRISSIPLGRAGTPDEVADAVEFILGSEWMTGSTITIDGGRMVNWLGADIDANKKVVQSKL